MQRMLLGISPNSRVQPHNWQAYTARKLQAYYPHDNPMCGVQKGQEAVAYAALSAQERCCSPPVDFSYAVTGVFVTLLRTMVGSRSDMRALEMHQSSRERRAWAPLV
jgi:hypothetical protein